MHCTSNESRLLKAFLYPAVGGDLSPVRACEARLEGGILRLCQAKKVHVFDSVFRNCVVMDSLFDYVSFFRCTFEDCRLEQVYVSHLSCIGCKFSRCAFHHVTAPTPYFVQNSMLDCTFHESFQR